MAYFPRGRPVACDTQFNTRIVLQHFAHRHLTGVFAVARLGFGKALVRGTGQFIAGAGVGHQIGD